MKHATPRIHPTSIALHSPEPGPWLYDAPEGLGLGRSRRQALAISAGKAAELCGRIAVLAILARTLDPLTFGLFLQGWLVVAAIAPIVTLGLPQALHFLIPGLSRETGRQIVWLSIALIGLVALPTALLLAAIPAATGWAVGVPALAQFAPALAIWLLASVIGRMFEPIAIVANKPHWLIGVQWLHWLVAAIVTASVAPNGDLQALFWAFAGLGLLRSLAAGLAIQNVFGLWSVGMDPKPLRGLAGLSLFLGLSAAFGALSAQIDKIVACHWFGPEAYAFYGIGTIQIPAAPTLIVLASAATIVSVRRAMSNGNEIEALRLLRQSASNLAKGIFPLFFYFLIFGPLWIRILFGQRYEPSVPIFLVFLFVTPLAVLHADAVLAQRGLRREWLRSQAIFLALNLLLALLLSATRLGPLGPALSTVLALAAQKAWQTMVLARRFGVPPWRLWPWRRLAIPLWWAGGGAALAALLIPLVGDAEWIRLAAGTTGYAAWTIYFLRQSFKR